MSFLTHFTLLLSFSAKFCCFYSFLRSAATSASAVDTFMRRLCGRPSRSAFINCSFCSQVVTRERAKSVSLSDVTVLINISIYTTSVVCFSHKLWTTSLFNFRTSGVIVRISSQKCEYTFFLSFFFKLNRHLTTRTQQYAWCRPSFP